MNVSNKASWAPNEYVAKTLIKCAQHQQPKQSVFQSPWWWHTFTLKPMYDVSLDVFVWFSRPHHLLVFINLRKRLTHYFKTSLTSRKCNGFDVIETSLPRFCARRLRNVFRTKNGSLGLSGLYKTFVGKPPVSAARPYHCTAFSYRVDMHSELLLWISGQLPGQFITVSYAIGPNGKRIKSHCQTPLVAFVITEIS